MAFIKNNIVDGNQLLLFYLYNDNKSLNKDIYNDNTIISGQDHIDVINKLLEEN